MKERVLYTAVDATGQTVRVIRDCTGFEPPAFIFEGALRLRLTLRATLLDPAKKQVLVTGVHAKRSNEGYLRFLDDLFHTDKRDRGLAS